MAKEYDLGDVRGKTPYIVAQEAGYTGTEDTLNAALAGTPAHLADTDNPHGVTAEQAGADPAGAAQTVQSNLTAHMTDAVRHITAEERAAWNAKAAMDLSNVPDADFLTKAKAAGVGAGGAGKRTCRFVVGTSAAGWTDSDCDYLCDGTDDQAEIQAAIDALPEAGGEVVVLDGTYIITDVIQINKANICLQGSGRPTLQVGETEMYSVIYTNKENSKINGFVIDIHNTYRHGIRVYGEHCLIENTEIMNAVGLQTLIEVGASYCVIERCRFCNSSFQTMDVYLGGMLNATGCKLHANTHENSGYIYAIDTNDLEITNNLMRGSAGISIDGSKQYCLVDGNILSGITSHAIRISGREYIQISNNLCAPAYTSSAGIKVSSGNHCKITGNIVKMPQKSTHGSIELESGAATCVVSDNMLVGRDYTNAGTDNQFIDNVFLEA